MDWASDHIRLTTNDFRKLYFKKDDEFTEIPFLKLDWQSQNILTRWDTVGVFSPDPIAVKMVERFADNILVGTSEGLKTYNWPAMKPGQKSQMVQTGNVKKICKTEKQIFAHIDDLIYIFE